jgi:hypothetical protein
MKFSISDEPLMKVRQMSASLLWLKVVVRFS